MNLSRSIIARFCFLTLCISAVPTPSLKANFPTVSIELLALYAFRTFVVATIAAYGNKVSNNLEKQSEDINASIQEQVKNINTQLNQARQALQKEAQRVDEYEQSLHTNDAAKVKIWLSVLASAATAAHPYDTAQASQALMAGVDREYENASEENDQAKMTLLNDLKKELANKAALQELLSACQKQAGNQ